MSTEENKASVRRIIEELWNEGNMAVCDEVLAPNYVFRIPDGQEYKGADGLKQYVTMARTAFPDLHLTIDDMFAEGDKVAIRCTWTGTFKGEMMGIAPTGKQIKMNAAVFCRFEGGKEVEAVELADQLTMFQQLGVSPPTGQREG